MHALPQLIFLIISEWDTMDEFKPIGKVLFYLPCLINNILRTMMIIIFSPFIWLYYYVNEIDVDEFTSR